LSTLFFKEVFLKVGAETSVMSAAKEADKHVVKSAIADGAEVVTVDDKLLPSDDFYRYRSCREWGCFLLEIELQYC
jgi:hypothetical protein